MKVVGILENIDFIRNTDRQKRLILSTLVAAVKTMHKIK